MNETWLLSYETCRLSALHLHGLKNLQVAILSPLFLFVLVFMFVLWASRPEKNPPTIMNLHSQRVENSMHHLPIWTIILSFEKVVSCVKDTNWTQAHRLHIWMFIFWRTLLSAVQTCIFSFSWSQMQIYKNKAIAMSALGQQLYEILTWIIHTQNTVSFFKTHFTYLYIFYIYILWDCVPHFHFLRAIQASFFFFLLIF